MLYKKMAEARNDAYSTVFIWKMNFLDRPMKGGDILDFQKGGNLRKGGV